jgi:replicative DNA helicase
MNNEHKQRVSHAWDSLGPNKACHALRLNFQKSGRRAVINCLWHNDSTPSCSVQIGEHGSLQFHCFSGCNRSWDIFSAVAQLEGLDVENDFKQVLARAAELVGMYDVVEALGEKPTGKPVPLRPQPTAPADRSRKHVDPEELDEFLGGCVGCDQDSDVAAQLRLRGLNPVDVALRGLAFALPQNSTLPKWASYKGKMPTRQTWVESGHRLILPMYDSTATVRGVRAWRITQGETPKRLPPAGAKASELVMLDPVAIERFKNGWDPTEERRIVVCEGEPDFLSWATRAPVGEQKYAVVGIVSGSWCNDIAKKFPGGSQVAVWTDDDDAGDKYAAAIESSSVGSSCSILRMKFPDKSDANDVLCRGGTLPDPFDTRFCVNPDMVDHRPAMSIVLQSVYGQMSNPFVGPKGELTGYKKLDYALDGWQRSRSYVIGGRTGHGKSTLALNIGMRLADRGCAVDYITPEMTVEQQVMRALFSWGNVDRNRLKNGSLRSQDFTALVEASKQMKSWDWIWNPVRSQTVEDIRAHVIRAQQRFKSRGKELHTVIIDHMLRVKGTNQRQPRREQLVHITKSLDDISKDLGVCMITLTQLGRAGEARGVKDKRPVISDLKESGSIEEDADFILLMYRADMYERDRSKWTNILQLNCAKVRDGEPKNIKLLFRGERCRIDTLSEEYEDSNEEAEEEYEEAV